MVPAMVAGLGEAAVLRVIGFYTAAKSGPGATTLPSALWLVLLVIAMLIVIAVFIAIPTRLGVRRPVSEILQTGAS